MKCPLCGHLKAHKYGKTAGGVQRYLCPSCQQTFNEHQAEIAGVKSIEALQVEIAALRAEIRALSHPNSE